MYKFVQNIESSVFQKKYKRRIQFQERNKFNSRTKKILIIFVDLKKKLIEIM